MEKNYKGYSADRLLTDELFIDWQHNPVPETDAFWHAQCNADPVLSREVRIASGMLGALEDRGPRMSTLEKSLLWNKITVGTVTRKRSRKYLLPLGITASAVAAVLLGIIFFIPGNKGEVDYLSMIEDIEGDGAMSGSVQLIMDDRQNIALEGNETFVRYDQDGNVTANDEVIESAAAAPKEIKYNRLLVPAGKRSQVTLSDGTIMWVNSGTRVVYPVVFTGDKREIFADGEVYLEVSPDHSRPFRVKGGNMDLTVLGTHFNFSAYKHSEASVVLVEGSVRVETPGKRSDILQPGQMLTLGEQVTVSQVNVYDYIAWKDGFYIFRNETLSAILGKISDYYEVGLSYDRNVENITCSGKLAFNEDLEAVIATLNDVVPQARIKYGDSVISIE